MTDSGARRTKTHWKAIKKHMINFKKMTTCAMRGCLRLSAALKLWYLRRTLRYQMMQRMGMMYAGRLVMTLHSEQGITMLVTQFIMHYQSKTRQVFVEMWKMPTCGIFSSVENEKSSSNARCHEAIRDASSRIFNRLIWGIWVEKKVRRTVKALRRGNERCE